MNKLSMKFRRMGLLLLALVLILGMFAGCGGNTDEPPENGADLDLPAEASAEVLIQLSDEEIRVNEAALPDEGFAGVSLSNDIVYYEDKDAYESGNPYGEGEAHERHTAEEAAANTVVNITEAGTYRVQGQLSKGQIRIDLGEDAAENPEAVVNLILDGVDLTCDVAPAILFMNVYECDNGWTVESAKSEVDTTRAGANLLLADGSENNINGSHVARIYKDNPDEKKLWKQDGAIYSYMSMNVDAVTNGAGAPEGTGVLNLTADNEGMDTELHLTINAGNINIFADNDGINTNEDGVSVTTINGGNIHIMAGLGAEGDGIDSNGWLVINGGTVVASAHPASDAGMDSDMGSFVNGGTVVALGSTMDWAESDSEQITMNLQFAEYEASDSAIVITDLEGNAVFAYDPSEDEVLGSNARQYMGAVISCPNFVLEAEYNVYIGGAVTGTEIAGIYDVSTITDYTGGVKQAYTGTDVRRGPGGFGGGMPPEGFDGERPEPPEGFEGGFPGGQMPEGMEPPAGFEGGPGGGRPNGGGFPGGEMPEGFEPPEDFDGKMPEGFMPPGDFGGEDQPELPPSDTFYMQDKVNNFSGLKDA